MRAYLCLFIFIHRPLRKYYMHLCRRMESDVEYGQCEDVELTSIRVDRGHPQERESIPTPTPQPKPYMASNLVPAGIYLILFYLHVIYLPTCLSLCLSLGLSVCLSVCLSVSLSVSLSVCLSVSLSVCLSFCLSVCLSVCLAV